MTNPIIEVEPSSFGEEVFRVSSYSGARTFTISGRALDTELKKINDTVSDEDRAVRGAMNDAAMRAWYNKAD